MNTVDLGLAIGWLRKKVSIAVADQLLLAIGFYTWPRGLWEGDHRVSVELGGGGCGLDGFDTLCVPCHKRKTKADLAAGAQARRESKASGQASQPGQAAGPA